MAAGITSLDVALAFVGIWLVKALLSRKTQSAPLPPGPKGLPLIGNVFDMPESHDWLKFTEWNQRHGNEHLHNTIVSRIVTLNRTTGDIVHISLMGQHVTILGSITRAINMLDKRSTIYSGRPLLTMGGDLVGWSNTLALTQYGERFREYRRLAHKLFGSRIQVEKYHDLEEHETRKFLSRVLHGPENVAGHIRKSVVVYSLQLFNCIILTLLRRMAGSIILMLTHGYEVQEHDDPVVKVVDEATEQFSDATAPGAFLVDVFPLLRYIPSWVPGAGFQKKAQEWRRTLNNMVETPYNLAKNRMV